MILCYAITVFLISNILYLTNSYYIYNNVINKLSINRLPSVVEPSIPSLKDVKNNIKDIVKPDQIESVRLRHIVVASEDVAMECKKLINNNEINFKELANSLSLCEETKSLGGEIGWVKVENPDSDNNDRNIFNTLGAFPPELINAAVSMNKGEIAIVSSNNVAKQWHVLQLMDVITKLTPALKKRKYEGFKMQQRTTNIRNNDENSGEKVLTYSIDTMGCQMNVADSERIEGQLRDLGYQSLELFNELNKPGSDNQKMKSRTKSNLVPEGEKQADVVIINTCSIRDHAEQKVYSYIGPHAARKRKGEDVSIIVAGCVAQQEGESLIKRFPEVDVVMGPQYANRLSDLLTAVFDGNQVVATDPAYQMEDDVPALRSHSETSAFVNIIYGCNERCTYCVVPNTRGVEQSRTQEAILAEVAELVEHGYKEITLLGQNVDSWGRDMNPKQKFADLLRAVAQVPGIERVRFLTSHPKYMSERVIQAVADFPTLMPYFNVPFQSGDTEVLKMMRRGYSRERYLAITSKIRELVPDASIVADCIVGFPGETEEQFEATLSLMEEVQFDRIYTAAYSPRPNTPAALWNNQVPDDIKQDRLQRINRLATVHALNRSSRFIGRIQEVLVEDVDMKNPTQVIGKNPHGTVVHFQGSIAELKGKIVKVKIVNAKPYSLIAELCNN